MSHRLPPLSALSTLTTAWLGVALVAFTLSGCRIEHKAAATEAASAPAQTAAGAFENKNFDPKTQVVDIWEGKVLPAVAAKAGNFPDLVKAMKAGLDAAGAAHGFRERGEGAPWNFSVRLTGKIVQVDTESSAGKIGVDVNGDGQPDATVQIGPILRGTALRDSLPFISFTTYTNQIEFAQLANAFNDHVNAVVLKPLPREQLQGRTVELLGVFTTDDASEAPVITPVQLKLGAPS